MQIQFWIQKDRTKKAANDGCYGVVACAILMEPKQEANFVTSIRVKHGEWEGNKRRFNQNRADQHAANAALANIEAKINEIYSSLLVLHASDSITPSMLIQSYKYFEQPESVGKKPTLVNLKESLKGHTNICPTLLEAVAQLREEKAKTVSKGTLCTYQTRTKNLEKFLKSVKKPGLRADEFRPYWCKKFRDYMLAQGMNVNHISRHIIFFREALDELVENEVLTINPMGKFLVSRQETKDLRHLTEQEIERLENFDFSTTQFSENYKQSLAKSRDMFLFLIYTALHYVDYMSLTSTDVQERKSGLWIIKERTKTGQPAHIPILGKFLVLWKKYGSVETLPRVSKNALNNHLKIIAQLVGISVQNLSSKIGRKTSANKMLNIDTLDKDSVSFIMGLKTPRHIEDYAQVKIERIETVLKNKNGRN